MSTVISPTPGRIVWYYPAANENLPRVGAQPLAAMVVGVFGDHDINLAVFDANGDVQRRSSVHLVQPDEERPNGAHATWMPHQVTQSKPPITEADALADLNGTPRPDNPTVKNGIAPWAPAPVPESDPNSEGSTTD